MRFLGKTLVAVVLVILLKVAKIVLVKMFPLAAVFIYNFFSCLQLFVLGWAVATGLLELFFWKKKSASKAFIRSMLTYLGILTVVELFFLFLLFNPQHIPATWLPAFQYYYNNYQRQILQYDTAISGYHDSVFYKMKPNRKFLFQNIEFADSVYTNSGGFRSDEQSMLHKKIICAGDSYTLGWGVHQDETYTSQLQKLTGMSVLNTGMSSYGTAREIETVKLLDTGDAGFLVIQYCNNDFDENNSYVQHHDSLVISPKPAYDAACDLYHWSSAYFPGKCFFTVAKIFSKMQVDGYFQKKGATRNSLAPAINNTDTAARYFLEVLRHSGLNFSKLHLVVFDICEHEQLNSDFINAVEKQLESPENLSFFNHRVELVRVAEVLNANDYYILDGHIRAPGQKKVALAVAGAVARFK